MGSLARRQTLILKNKKNKKIKNCMFLSRHQNARQHHDIKTTKSTFKTVTQFKYFGTITTNQNLIQEEAKRRLNLVMLATVQSRTFFVVFAV
jgi:hypothetical protein